MSIDAPDWRKIVTVVAGGPVSDAPDWERVVTGPGGGSIGGGYSSLTGAGETATPGDLAQAGGLKVNAFNTGTEGFVVDVYENGALTIQQHSGDFVLAQDTVGGLLNISSNGDIQIAASHGGGITIETAFSTADITINTPGGTLVLESGNITMPFLPTTNPGGTGQLWNNAGVLNIT